MGGRRKAITYAPKRNKKKPVPKVSPKKEPPLQGRKRQVGPDVKLIKKLSLILQVGTTHWATHNDEDTKRMPFPTSN
jgi:hypothetical protein